MPNIDLMNEFWKQIDGKLSRGLLTKTLDELRNQYYKYCIKKSGEEIADQIAQVDFTTFREKVGLALKRIIEKELPKSQKENEPVKACLFEYDPCNKWYTGFYLCLEYTKAKNKDDDWAGEWKKDVKGPRVPSFAKMKIDENFGVKENSLGAYVYAHARVVIEFTQACREFTSPVPICIGYHDQSGVSRVFPDSHFNLDS
jgi:hypothetical protein